jgi:hypothetical protein
VPDFALFGRMRRVGGVDGWQRVQSRQHVAHCLRTLAEPTNDPTEPGDELPRKPSNGRGQRLPS